MHFLKIRKKYYIKTSIFHQAKVCTNIYKIHCRPKLGNDLKTTGAMVSMQIKNILKCKLIMHAFSVSFMKYTLKNAF